MAQESDNPERILLIRPCCIGDVVMATATLKAVRRGYPNAHITWAVGTWSRQIVEFHPYVDEILDTGTRDMPVRTMAEFWRFVRQIRNGHYDLVISLVRSPIMSLAVMLGGSKLRVGLSSGWRGFGYNLQVRADPEPIRHEAEIFLDCARALRLSDTECWANVPVREEAQATITARLTKDEVLGKYCVIHPGGGDNPGAKRHDKRWTPEYFAQLADRLAENYSVDVILIGSEADTPLLEQVSSSMTKLPIVYAGDLNFAEIGALAEGAMVYIGNDTGLTHLAAASGGHTVMIMGPTSPARYAPFSPNAIAAWKTPEHSHNIDSWDWERDGVSVDEVFQRVILFLQEQAVIEASDK